MYSTVHDRTVRDRLEHDRTVRDRLENEMPVYRTVRYSAV